jgi:hypothetical protein
MASLVKMASRYGSAPCHAKIRDLKLDNVMGTGKLCIAEERWLRTSCP